MVEVDNCLLLLMRKKRDKSRIFLGRVDQVETELELAGSQATNQAVGMNAPTTWHLGTACAIEPHPRRTTAESPPDVNSYAC